MIDPDWPYGDDMMPPVDKVRPDSWDEPGQWGDDWLDPQDAPGSKDPAPLAQQESAAPF